MPEKQKTRNWKDPKTIIAAVSVTMLVTIWNTFATHDRRRVENADSLSTSPTPGATVDRPCPTPVKPNDQIKSLKNGCVPVTSTRSS